MRVSSSISYVLRLPGAFANAFRALTVSVAALPFFLLCHEVLSGQSRKKGMFIFGLLPRTALRLSWAIFVRPAGTGEMPGRWEAWEGCARVGDSCNAEIQSTKSWAFLNQPSLELLRVLAIGRRSAQDCIASCNCPRTCPPQVTTHKKRRVSA